MGVDPGFANMGVAVVDSDLRVLEAYTVGTSKTGNKKRRVTDDDVDRMNLLWLNLRQTVEEFKPDAVAVESYTVFRPEQGGQGKGAGWKAVYAYAMACTVAFEHALPIYAFRPGDLKRIVAKDKSASKVDVEDAVRKVVANLDEFLEGIPSGAHEHAADAVGLALCGLERLA